MPRNNSNGERLRQTVAQEAARIIINQGIRDYGVAKRKAQERLGVNARGTLPGNTEIERAIEEHHLLFGGESHANFLRLMRQSAISAMNMLKAFAPRLVGPVLAGTADQNSAVNLHVFSDSPEKLAMMLEAREIPYRSYERRLKNRRNRTNTFAGYEFEHAAAAIQATVFPVDGIRQAPLSPIDGKPMDRASLERVKRLLE